MRKHLFSLSYIVLSIISVLLVSCIGNSETNLTPAIGTVLTAETPVSTFVPKLLQAGSIPLYASADYPQSPDSHLDLDTGLSWQVTTQADIKFAVSNNSQSSYFLQPVNGAWANLVGTNEPEFNGCKQTITALKPNPITDLEVGTYLCVLTNQGHLAQLKVEKLHNLGEGSIRLRFITWDEMFEDFVENLATAYPITATPTIPQPTNLPPTNTPLPETPILQDGFIRLQADLLVPYNSGASLDLDTNSTPINTIEADIQFSVSRGGGGMYFYFLLPVNGARASAIGMTEPSLDGCQETVGNLLTASIDNISVGMYLCVTSSEGRLAQLHIEDANFTEGWIEVSFLTWDIVAEQ